MSCFLALFSSMYVMRLCLKYLSGILGTSVTKHIKGGGSYFAEVGN